MANIRPSQPSGYAYLTRAAIDATPIPQRCREASAVVLERIARGGGETRWYLITTPADLSEVIELLRPGSAVSFYFDGRIAESDPTSAKDEILAIAARDINAVVAAYGDEPELRVDFVSGAADLADFVAELCPDERFLFGPFPGRDNDGFAAVTLDLPDPDGVVRPHPH
jgi:hypothetical protein